MVHSGRPERTKVQVFSIRESGSVNQPVNHFYLKPLLKKVKHQYPMREMILSPYTFLFEENNEYFLFNSESLFFSKISEETFILLSERSFNEFKDEAITILLEKKILIDREDRDLHYNHLLTRHLTSAYSDDTMSLIIAPTTACNFACPYCFEPKKNPKTITTEVEDKIIEYLNKQEHIRKISLIWYGGEPLLAAETIGRLYRRICAETEKEITSQEIISNTYLVNESIIEMFRECRINRIQVSIDGIKEHHDKTRCLKGSKAPTFDVIERNIKKLAMSLPDLQISIRVNIDKNNWTDFVDLYHKYHGEEWHKNIGLYPGIIREDSTDGHTVRHHCFKISDLVDLHLKLAERGVNVNLLPSSRFKGCMLQRANAFIIGPEGELYKCWDDVSRPERIIGSIMDNELHNYRLLMRYMQDCRPIREECRGCLVFPICDGGCGRQLYRNRFEGAEFQLCSPLKDSENLKKALLHSIRSRRETDRKILSL